DSTVTLHLTVNTAQPVHVEYSATIEQGQAYLFGCNVLETAGDYDAVYGDSTVTLHLAVNTAQPVHVEYSATIEQGQAYLFGCNVLEADGDYDAVYGDSTVTVHLTIQPQSQDIHVQYSTEITTDENYLFLCEVLHFDETGPQSITRTIPRVGNIGDSIITLNLTVMAGGSARNFEYDATIEQGQAYLFGCDVLETTGDYTAIYSDSIVTVHLTVNTAQPVHVEYDAEINQGQAYLFGCNVLETAGDYDAVYGDSTVTVHLTVITCPATPVVTDTVATICAGDLPYSWHGKSLNNDTTMCDDTLKTTLGCDSIARLQLIVQRVVLDSVVTKSICKGEPVEWKRRDGSDIPFTIDETMDYKEYHDTLRYANAPKCDSMLYTLKLVILQPSAPSTAPAVEACDSYNWVDAAQGFDTLIVTTGNYTHKFRNNAGCDSVVTLPVTIYDAVAPSTAPAVVACDSYNWTDAAQGFDTLIVTSGNYTHKFRTIHGCDSVVTLPVTIHKSATPSYAPTQIVCDSFRWADAAQSFDTLIVSTGDYTHKFQTSHGCDSIVTLPVIVYHAAAPSTAPAVEACESYNWVDAAQGFDTLIVTSGNYTHKFQTVNGCDSIVTLPVTIYNAAAPSTAPAVEACESYNWADAAQGFDTLIVTSGNYTHKFQTIHGCDSVVTLPVTIYNAAAPSTAPAVEACESYNWADAAQGFDTLIVTSGSYTHKFQTIHGCDSVVTLPVTIYHAAAPSTAPAVESCDSYKWTDAAQGFDTLIVTSGNYTHTFQTIHGCDSVVTLPVTIKKSVKRTVEETACDFWIDYDDVKQTKSGEYVYYFTAANGCDSIVTVELTIYNSAPKTVLFDTACVAYTWSVNNVEYKESTVVSETLKTIHGCDSVVELNLTILQPIIGDTAATECNMFTWRDVTYYTDTIVFDTIAGAASNGCDSIVRLDLKIGKPFVGELDLISQYDDRLLMINRTQINKLLADSLGRTDDTTYVKWYREAEPEDEFLGIGYYYTMPDGSPVPAGVYYAVIEIPGGAGACPAKGETMHYVVKAKAGAPALVPSLARPGQDIKVINLNPDQRYTIRIYTTEGILQDTYTTNGESTFIIRAADMHGFYLVELNDENMKSTLRYIVK
ncbi:MAG: hypothetical protein J5884_00090, partial [Paludibacteraceae bacterium]|nr:hypothetical protein [Paludibacteraceae bacterium]